MYEKLVVVTRKTRFQELVERFNTGAQAKFYLKHAGLDFGEYQAEDDAYRQSLDTLRKSLDVGLKVQWLDRSLLSTYLFDERDVVVAAGQDGLVANTAKYVGAQPLIGVNPDPERFDGALLPFSVRDARGALLRTLDGRAKKRPATLAEAKLSDGQRLLAFNELFVGMQDHVSARYRLRVGDQEWERQSSSGLLIATGAGSTGWVSSMFQLVNAVNRFHGLGTAPAPKFTMQDPRLFFIVREPFVSKHSTARQVLGWLEPGQRLTVESLMPQGGAVFSDGVQSDALQFGSGRVATIEAARQTAQLVVG